MKYLLAKHQVFGFTFILLMAAIQPVVAQLPGEQHPAELQGESWISEVPCKGNANKHRVGYIDSREFRLCFDFSAEKLQPASDGKTNNSELYITSYAKKGRPNLTKLEVERVHEEGNPGLTLKKIAVPEGPEQNGELTTKRVFRVTVGVTDQARSGFYPIALLMTSGKDTAENEFTLPIFAPNNSVLVKPKNQSLVDCWSGSNCSALELEVQNKLPYKISIAKISITSGDLLESQPTGDYLIGIDSNTSPRDLNLVMKAKPLSLSRVLRGFGQPQLYFRIDYQDEYGRAFSTESKADLEIRPDVLMIGIFLVVGAAVGTFLRRDPGKFQMTNLTTRKQRWCFIGTTFVTGILICLIAIVLNIKIVVLSNDNSLSAWDPKMLLATAFVATFGGLPLIYAYFKIPRPSDTPPPAPGPNATGNNNN